MINERPINRARPLLATHQYKTYAVRSPLSTHHRRATCAEVGCPDYLNGWYLKLAGLPEDLLYIATHSGKRYTQGEVMLPTGEVFQALIFEAGQGCFNEPTHTKPLDRPEFFFAGRGDYRSFSHRKAQQFDKAEHFVESFEEHLAGIRQVIERG